VSAFQVPSALAVALVRVAPAGTPEMTTLFRLSEPSLSLRAAPRWSPTGLPSPTWSGADVIVAPLATGVAFSVTVESVTVWSPSRSVAVAATLSWWCR
jgi:hypothetical protein